MVQYLTWRCRQIQMEKWLSLLEQKKLQTRFCKILISLCSLGLSVFEAIFCRLQCFTSEPSKPYPIPNAHLNFMDRTTLQNWGRLILHTSTINQIAVVLVLAWMEVSRSALQDYCLPSFVGILDTYCEMFLQYNVYSCLVKLKFHSFVTISKPCEMSNAISKLVFGTKTQA